VPSPASPDAGPARRSSWLLAGLAVLTGLLGLLAVLAPVIADDPVVSWPRAGEAPTSTVLPLSPYRPLQLDATVPCATLRALDARGGGDALRTVPADASDAGAEGVVVAAADGSVTVTASGADLVTEPLPAGDCTYLVAADAGGVRVSRDGTGLVAEPGLLPPQVAQLETAAEGLPAAAGLAVELHTDARYESTPTVLKNVLLVLHGVALAALLMLAWRRWRGAGPGLVRPRLSAADAAVVAVSMAWAVLGPMNIDDSWYLLMARNAQESGYVGNYIYQFNVTENPFSTSQYVMQAWGALGGWGLLWMRLLPLTYGLVTYGLLRVLLTTALERVGWWQPVPWALAAAHLLWFLSYGITLRPEPLIVVGTAAVMVLAELARRRESVGVLGTATALAALTVTVSPTGLVAFAPLLFALPWLLRWLRAADWSSRVGAVLLGAVAASVVVLPGFADASLGDVLESTAVHRWYYRQYPWYAEFVHYQNLLDTSDQGSWARRLPVLLTLAVLLGAAIAAGRRSGTGGPVGALLARSAVVTALALASMMLTPTKWVNHFGAVAAPATVLLAAAVLRSPVPRRAPAAAVVLATVVTGAAAAIGFAGPNLWRPFSDWGQPFGNHANIDTPFEFSLTAPSIGPFALRNPVLWLAVALAAVWWVRRRDRPVGLTPDRAVLVTAMSLTVALLLAVFTVAPLRQYPGPSIALMNVQALAGARCGLAGDVQVLADAQRGLGAPVGVAELNGSLRAAGLPDRPLPANRPAAVWHDDVADSTTGSLRTPWYPLPAVDEDAAVLVPLAGDRAPEQRVVLEFATGTPGDPEQVSTVVLDPGPFSDGWTEVSTGLADVKLKDPTAVRVTAVDRLAGPETWIAVAEPRLVQPRGITQLTAGKAVFADQVSAALWPCVDQVAIGNGIAEAPEIRLRAGDGLEGAVEDNSVFPPNGGTLVQLDRTAEFAELPSSLSPVGAPTLQWGHVERVNPDHPVGLVDLRVERVQRWGWVRLPTLAGEAYTGRTYIG